MSDERTRRTALHVVVDGDRPGEPDGRLYEEFVLPVLDDLYRFACRVEGDRHRAKDLLQETLLRGLRKFGQFEHRGPFRVWISRILWRTHLNRQSASQAALERRQAAVEPDLAAAEGGTGGVWDPERRLLARRLRRELRQALDDLPAAQRTAIWLIDIQGFSYADAAHVLDAPPGTIASRVARGRAALRAALGHLAQERGWGTR